MLTDRPKAAMGLGVSSRPMIAPPSGAPLLVIRLRSACTVKGTYPGKIESLSRPGNCDSRPGNAISRELTSLLAVHRILSFSQQHSHLLCLSIFFGHCCLFLGVIYSSSKDKSIDYYCIYRKLLKHIKIFLSSL